MKKLFSIKSLLIIAGCMLTMESFVLAQKKYTLESPSKELELSIFIGTDIKWSLKDAGHILLDKSEISMTLEDGTVWGSSPKLRKNKKSSHSGIIHPPLYRKEIIKDNYNELKLEFKEDYALIFRAYDEGVAYRFVSRRKQPFKVVNEQADFNFPGDPKAFFPYVNGRKNDGVVDPFYSAFQSTYDYENLSKWKKGKMAILPLLIEGDKGRKICITEADLINYPGMFLKGNPISGTLTSVFAAYPKKVVTEVRGTKDVVKSRENYIAKIAGEKKFPWRIVSVSKEDKDLLDNDMVYKLAQPAQFSDFSWIKPGKVAWDWWNDWGIYGVDFKSGINTQTYKYYIDFASKNNLEYVILDEGWFEEGETGSLFKVVPDIDLPEIIQYAKERNVDIILWAAYKMFNQEMEAACKHYAQMGVKGFKVDFMDRNDQKMIDFNYRAAQTTAKYHLLLDLHGTAKPTGLQRTYPNVINFEGVYGLEEMKWADTDVDQVKYDVTMPFIRMVAGPVDYTQGAMRNVIKKNYRPVYSEPMSQGTRCRQLAEYVIFESPLNMLCDAPTNYMKEEECTKFISDIPTVWDQTVPLKSKVGEYVSIARRKKDTWYVGALTDWTPRDFDLHLSFLQKGSYKVEIFKDGVNADKVARDYKRVVKYINLPADAHTNIHMAPGGGFVIKITKQ